MKLIEQFKWIRQCTKTVKLYTAGSYDEALVYANKAHETVLKVFNKDHVNVAKVLYNLIAINHKLGNDKEALEYGKEAIRICEKIYGYDKLLIDYLEIVIPVCEALNEDDYKEELLAKVAQCKGINIEDAECFEDECEEKAECEEKECCKVKDIEESEEAHEENSEISECDKEEVK